MREKLIAKNKNRRMPWFFFTMSRNQEKIRRIFSSETEVKS